MSKTNAEFEVIVYGATSYTGQLVAEYLLKRYGTQDLKWAMAGRSADKLAQVRDALGAPADMPLIVADADNAADLQAMAERGRCILTTVGPYQLYGSLLVQICAETGTDYVDLTGEPNWMHEMVRKHEGKAQQSGARIVFSCGFDSVPFDLGVQFVQEQCRDRFGSAASRVKCRVMGMNGSFSGGTVASMQATVAAIGTNPDVLGVLTNPFSLATANSGNAGPQQPDDSKPYEDEDIDQWVSPFVMAAINTKNIHRSNALLGYPYGADFLYDEMMAAGEGDMGKAAAEFLTSFNPLEGENTPKPGEGPTPAEREAGNYDLLFLALHDEGVAKVRVTASQDPGYNATSRMIAESALCLTRDRQETAGGIYTPASAMGTALRSRLLADADQTFGFEVVAN